MGLSGDLVEPAWLASRLGEERLRIPDVTAPASPRSSWLVQHLLGTPSHVPENGDRRPIADYLLATSASASILHGDDVLA